MLLPIHIIHPIKMTSIITQKYALLVAFEYSSQEGVHNCDKPNNLISIDADLANMWSLCIDNFKIPRNNITIITDLKVNPKKANPWDIMDIHRDGNPSVTRMDFPCINNLVAEMIQFVENSIRDIHPIKGDECIKREAFIYFSGHGAYIPHPTRKKFTNGLIFLDHECGKRVYLSDSEIFKILFGQLEVCDDEDSEKGGYMSIPVVRRVIETTAVSSSNSNSTSNNKSKPLPSKVTFIEEAVVVNVNPSPSKHNRGLPYETSMLMVIDSCHSGTMADLPYIYTTGDKAKSIKPHMAKVEAEIKDGPYIVCIGATNDTQVAPSTEDGSPFTSNFATRVNQCREPVTIHKFQQILEYDLPSVLLGCSPTITSTSHHVSAVVPFVGVTQ